MIFHPPQTGTEIAILVDRLTSKRSGADDSKYGLLGKMMFPMMIPHDMMSKPTQTDMDDSFVPSKPTSKRLTAPKSLYKLLRSMKRSPPYDMMHKLSQHILRSLIPSDRRSKRPSASKGLYKLLRSMKRSPEEVIYEPHEPVNDDSFVPSNLIFKRATASKNLYKLLRSMKRSTGGVIYGQHQTDKDDSLVPSSYTPKRQVASKNLYKLLRSMKRSSISNPVTKSYGLDRGIDSLLRSTKRPFVPYRQGRDESKNINQYHLDPVANLLSTLFATRFSKGHSMTEMDRSTNFESSGSASPQNPLQHTNNSSSYQPSELLLRYINRPFKRNNNTYDRRTLHHKLRLMKRHILYWPLWNYETQDDSTDKEVNEELEDFQEQPDNQFNGKADYSVDKAGNEGLENAQTQQVNQPTEKFIFAPKREDNTDELYRLLRTMKRSTQIRSYLMRYISRLY